MQLKTIFVKCPNCNNWFWALIYCQIICPNCNKIYNFKFKRGNWISDKPIVVPTATIKKALESLTAEVFLRYPLSPTRFLVSWNEDDVDERRLIEDVDIRTITY